MQFWRAQAIFFLQIFLERSLQSPSPKLTFSFFPSEKLGLLAEDAIFSGAGSHILVPILQLLLDSPQVSIRAR